LLGKLQRAPQMGSRCAGGRCHLTRLIIEIMIGTFTPSAAPIPS
jgi:hypothetical protein